MKELILAMSFVTSASGGIPPEQLVGFACEIHDIYVEHGVDPLTMGGSIVFEYGGEKYAYYLEQLIPVCLESRK